MAAPLETFGVCALGSATIFIPILVLIFGFAIIAFGIYMFFKQRGERAEAMEGFAKANGLSYVPADLFSQASVSGTYKGRVLSCRFYSE